MCLFIYLRNAVETCVSSASVFLSLPFPSFVGGPLMVVGMKNVKYVLVIFVFFVISHLRCYKLTKQGSRKVDGNMKASEDELTCSICLEQVAGGELVRSLPCLHQVLPLYTLMNDVSQICLETVS